MRVFVEFSTETEQTSSKSGDCVSANVLGKTLLEIKFVRILKQNLICVVPIHCPTSNARSNEARLYIWNKEYSGTFEVSMIIVLLKCT